MKSPAAQDPVSPESAQAPKLPEQPPIEGALAEARKAHQAGDFRSATGWYRHVLERDPGNGAALLGFADTLTAQQRFQEAAQVYTAHIDGLGQNDPVAHLGLGRVQARLGHHFLAVRSFREALALNPGDGEARMHLAMSLSDSTVRKADEALKWASEAVTALPDDHAAHHTLAVVQSRRRDFPAAVTAIRRAIELVLADLKDNPGDLASVLRLDAYYRVLVDSLHSQTQFQPEVARTWLELSQARVRLATVQHTLRLFEALRDAIQAANRASGEVAVLQYVADLQFQLGLRDEAANTYRAILEAAPDNEPARQRLEQLSPDSATTNSESPE